MPAPLMKEVTIDYELLGSMACGWLTVRNAHAIINSDEAIHSGINSHAVQRLCHLLLCPEALSILSTLKAKVALLWCAITTNDLPSNGIVIFCCRCQALH